MTEGFARENGLIEIHSMKSYKVFATLLVLLSRCLPNMYLEDIITKTINKDGPDIRMLILGI